MYDRTLPESLTSVKSKVNTKVKFALEQMNKALEEICASTDTSAKDKFKIAQDYVLLYIRLENEVMKEAEHKENMKQKKFETKIKQYRALEAADQAGEGGKDTTQNTGVGFSATMN